jgi:perosamine synthetase
MKTYQILEQEFCKKFGYENAVAVSSGTAALHLALAALEFPPGSEIIIPDFTMISCGWACTYAGYKPVFVDCGDDLLIEPKKIIEEITRKTRAIMPVHIYGRVCELNSILAIAQKYDLRIIEDCAEAHGAQLLMRQHVGCLDIGCFSFYQNKIIHAEEGGMIVTKDSAFAERLRDMKNMSFGEQHDFFHQRIGFNYRMPEAEAELALESLRQFDSNLARRRELEQFCIEHTPKDFRMPYRDVVWVYDFKCAESQKRELVEKISLLRHSFIPMSRQPMYYDGRYVDTNAWKWSRKIVYLIINEYQKEAELKEALDKVFYL